MQNALRILPSAQTMSSLEIATLTGKTPSHITRDIKTMCEQLGYPILDNTDLQGVFIIKDSRQFITEILLDKEHSLTLMTGYDAKMRMAINRRWLELESKQTLSVPNFNNPAEAARAWANEYEAKLIAQSTKAEIGSRREATAMNTASQATKQVNKLKAELDKSKEYCTIKRMEMLYHGQKFNWRMLKNTSIEMCLDAIDIFDANYGTVKAYHIDAWKEAYAIEI